METSISLNHNQLCLCLRECLRIESVLYFKTLLSHWNIRGIEFMSAHELFELQYKKIQDFMDLIAEQYLILDPNNRILDEIEWLLTPENTQIDIGSCMQPKDFFYALSEGHTHIIRELKKLCSLAEFCQDYSTNDLASNLLQEHEKMRWLLRSHL